MYFFSVYFVCDFLTGEAGLARFCCLHEIKIVFEVVGNSTTPSVRK